MGVLDPTKLRQNLRVFWKLMNLQDCVWENHCRFIMKTILQEKETIQRAERRIIPYSSEIHWRLQNYSYKLGCCARKPHRWLLEHRWIKRFVWLLDRFHSVYSKWETSWRIYVIRLQTDKTASDMQARSFMARTLERIGNKWLAEGEASMGNWKTKGREC